MTSQVSSDLSKPKNWVIMDLCIKQYLCATLSKPCMKPELFCTAVLDRLAHRVPAIMNRTYSCITYSHSDSFTQAIPLMHGFHMVCATCTLYLYVGHVCYSGIVTE